MYGQDRQKDFFWGAVIGGAVATLTSLLFTTKKGKQIQEKIADTYEEIEDSVKNTFSEAKDKAEDVAEQVGKKASNMVNKAKSDDHHKDSK